MSHNSWSLFTTRHPRAHLVIGRLPADSGEISTTLTRNLQTQLRYLVDRFELSGAYSLAISRSEGTAEILVGFENRASADRLAVAVRAKKTGRYPEWASRKLFVLDEEAQSAIEALLVGSKPIRRAAQKPQDHPQRWMVRSGRRSFLDVI